MTATDQEHIKDIDLAIEDYSQSGHSLLRGHSQGTLLVCGIDE